MSGADADRLDQLAREIDQLAGRFKAVRVDTGRSLVVAPWHGQGAERFRSTWNGEFSRTLVSAEQFLLEACEALRRNAREQRDASGIPQPHHGFPWGFRFPHWEPPHLFIEKLKRWQNGLSDWQATLISLGGLAVGGVPGLIVGMTLTTGASPMEVIRQLGISTRDVIRGENMSPRLEAFANLCKRAPIVPGIDIGDVADLALVAWDQGGVLIDLVQHGPSDELARRQAEIGREAFDWGIDQVVELPYEAPRTVIGAGTDVFDIIFGTDTHSTWDSWTSPSGIIDHVESGFTRFLDESFGTNGGGGGGW